MSDLKWIARIHISKKGHEVYSPIKRFTSVDDALSYLNDTFPTHVWDKAEITLKSKASYMGERTLDNLFRHQNPELYEKFQNAQRSVCDCE